MTKAYQTLVDAQAATGLSDRELVFVAGTTAVGDAGQGHFVYRAAATDTASIDVIAVTAGGRLLRVTDPADAIADDIAAAVDTALRASALPLPSGAATAAKQDSIAAAVTALGANPTAAAIATAVDTALRATALPVSDAGGSTQYAEDAAHVSGHLGTMALVVRKDTAAAIAGSDGDYTALQVDSAGALRVTGGGATASEIGAAVNTLPALTNRSGTVTTGGTAQQVMAANAARNKASFVNLDATSGWLSEVGTAGVNAAGSIECKQGAGILIEGRGAVSYIHPTTGAKFTAVEG